MKVVIFGTGKIYQCNKVWIPMDDVLAFIDNDVKKQGRCFNGIQVRDPKYILHISFDKIVLMSAKVQEMKNQLLEMGISEDLIWDISRYKFECLRGVLKLFCHNEEQNILQKHILVISQHLTYDGATMAAIHTVKALQLRKYRVALAAPSGDKAFIEEMSGQGGVNIILCPAICYSDETDMYWIKQFDVVIVNVFPMLPCACEISKFKPVLWWMHEVKAAYGWVQEAFPQYDNISKMKYINIAAVSEIAKSNFEIYYPGKVRHIMPYGIPDEYNPVEKECDSGKFTFAIIGNICERKAQKVFVQAITNFKQTEIGELDFLIIGRDDERNYCDEVRKLADEIPQIKFLGQLTRDKMKAIYQNIDVVVCVSMEECLPTVMVEGMMHGKICIATDAAGMGNYITNGINGYICKTGDDRSLYETMKFIIENRSDLCSIKENARKTYEKYFTMESFGERLEKLIIDTKSNASSMIK